MAQRGVVGTSVPRIDLLPKVTGRVQYSSEQSFPNMLYAKVKRAPMAHARIVKIDVSRASQVPGVLAVVTGKDLPYLPGIVPPLATEEVAYANQGVAAVAALTKEAAEEAVDRIDVEYEELPAILDAEKALAEGKIARHLKVRRGDVAKALAAADVVVEHRFTTPLESTFPLERTCFVVRPDADGGITVVGTYSKPVQLQFLLAEALKIDPYMIRVRVPMLGGWFGSKNDEHTALLCAKLAMVSGRPVKLELTREETITDTGGRFPSIIHIKDGVSRSGKILAREIRAIFNGGAYSSGELLPNAAMAAVSVYDIPNISLDLYVVNTNMLTPHSKRSPMWYEMTFAVESQMDYVADTLKMDPVELRSVNLLDNGKENAIGEIMQAMSYREAIKRAAQAIGWGERAESTGVWRVGKGLAIGVKGEGGGVYQARVRLRGTGKVEVWVNLVENGAGSSTGIAQIVADQLGIPVEDVIFVPIVDGSDTLVSGLASGASGSRQLTNLGNAVILACQDLKRKVAVKASRKLNVPPELITVYGGRAYSVRDPKHSVALAELFTHARASGRSGPLISFVEGDEGFSEDFVGQATYVVRVGGLDPETGRATNGRASVCYVNAASAAEVAVNVETGQIRVNKFVAVQDVGKAINPQLVRWQIVGSVAMGLSSALSEELVVADGRISNANLADYKILTALDMPPNIEAIIIETPSREGPYGAKPVGEASIVPVAAAIRSAIHDAVGVWIDDLPITPEKVLLALRGRGV